MSAKKSTKKATQDLLEPIELPKPNKATLKEKTPREKPVALFAAEQVITDDSNFARELYHQSSFGSTTQDNKVKLSLIEALYLLEKERIVIKDLRGRPYDSTRFMRRAKKIEPNFWVRYNVFCDMRNRGYVVKTALKFGADFRVYDRGIKPGEDHARWVLYPIHEGTTLTWHEFAAKARVAHSTKKRLLIAIVDDESDVTYYEIRWVRP